ncbi:tetratricopeptide repeat protein [Vibrio parahaemolyticus]|nr:tetratricopeptide repeat protein [Vibrio parahaemolyticus]
MNDHIKRAIELRNNGDFEGSRKLLTRLLSNEDIAPQARLHIAWSYDNQGLESEAVQHYNAALAGDLDENDHFEALFGLASTYRSLSNYHDAAALFEKTRALFPNAKEVMPFYAMCLYNLGQHKKAVELLLTLLVDTTSSEDILMYKRAIKLYAQDLDRTW